MISLNLTVFLAVLTVFVTIFLRFLWFLTVSFSLPFNILISLAVYGLLLVLIHFLFLKNQKV